MNKCPSINEKSADLRAFYKMSFIYNAIIDGWSVKYLNNNKFEFINKDSAIKKEFLLENSLDKFIESNLNITPIIQTIEKSQ